MAYLDVRDNRRGTVYRLKFRIEGRERVLTFDDEASATEWVGVFNAVGPTRGLQMLTDTIEVDDGTPTVEDVIRRHIDALTGITSGTRADYRRDAARSIEPCWHAQPISALTRESVALWINDLEASGAAAKTIANRHALLAAIAGTAVREGWLPENPCTGLRLPARAKREMTFLSPHQFTDVLSRHGQHWHPLLITLAGTGLRWGEATALRIQDVSPDARELRVVQAWKRDPKGSDRVPGPPKTQRGRRTVEYGPQVAAVLAPLLHGRDPGELVFTNTAGRRIGSGSFHNRHWQPAVRAAQTDGVIIDRPRIHDLRHTYASWCLNAGVPIFVLSRLLGHESVTMTADLYGHLEPASRGLAAAASAAALDRVIPPHSNP